MTRIAPVPTSSRRHVHGEISRLMAQCRLAPAPSWPASTLKKAAANASAIIVYAGRGWSRYCHCAHTVAPAHSNQQAPLPSRPPTLDARRASIRLRDAPKPPIRYFFFPYIKLYLFCISIVFDVFIKKILN